MSHVYAKPAIINESVYMLVCMKNVYPCASAYKQVATAKREENKNYFLMLQHRDASE